MPTVCIAVVDEHGFRGISIAYDGYLANVGRLLLDHYEAVDDIDALMRIGAASTLKADISEMAFIPGAPRLFGMDDVYAQDYDE